MEDIKITLREGVEVESTADCVAILNEYKKGKWKRKTKFNLNLPYEGVNIVRVFQKDNEFVTLIQTEEGLLFCKDLNLSEQKSFIDKLTLLAKNYYTSDYGALFYNPFKKSVIIVGGDSGVIYCEKRGKEAIKMALKEQQSLSHDDILPHLKIEGLTTSEIVAEESPEYIAEGQTEINEEYLNYIEIGYIDNTTLDEVVESDWESGMYNEDDL